MSSLVKLIGIYFVHYSDHHLNSGQLVQYSNDIQLSGI